MKKTKALFTLLLILCMTLVPFTRVNAHTVELDQEDLISFPMMVIGGKGTITIDDEITNYTLYYQALEIPDNIYAQIEETRVNGQITLDEIDEELDAIDVECDNLKAIYDEAFEEYSTKLKDDTAAEEEVEEAKTAYEEAKTNYQNKVTEFNNKAEEYDVKRDEINSNINILIPTYVEDNWVKTEDGSFAIDLTQFSGDKVFALWAKLVCSDQTIVYDVTYTVSKGTKPQEIAVETITLDKSEVTITEGGSYTLLPTITPEDATNKSVIWTSEDESIAKVEDGKITAVTEGTTTIIATTKDGGHTATCEVTVAKKSTTPTSTPDTEDKEPDTTIAESEIPKAGSLTYIIVFTILALGIIGIITYKKAQYLNFK